VISWRRENISIVELARLELFTHHQHGKHKLTTIWRLSMKFINDNKKFPLAACSLTALFGLAACGDATNLGQVQESLENGESASISISTDDDGNLVIGSGDASGDDGAAGGVFVMSNILDDNTIVSYSRGDDGTLSLVGEFSTGGQGGDFDGPEVLMTVC